MTHRPDPGDRLCPLPGIRGMRPAIDLLRSRSTTTITDRHAAIADEARDLLRTCRERTMDPELLELLAVRASTCKPPPIRTPPWSPAPDAWRRS